MFKANIRLLTSGKGPRDDEVINFREVEYEDGGRMFDVTYSSPDLKLTRSFVGPEYKVLQYLEDILSSVRHDTQPFEHIQVSTAIHPPILYHAMDMDDSDIRHLILNMVRDSLRTTISRKPKNESE